MATYEGNDLSPATAKPSDQATRTAIERIRASTIRTAMACFKDDSGNAIVAARHHELMVFVLERPFLGYTTINAPPGFAKTFWVDFTIARMIALNPNIRVVYVSAAETLALKQSVMIRDTIAHNQAFRSLYPECRKDTSGKAWGATQWFVKRSAQNDPNPTYTAFGLDGQVLGARADLLVLDDLNTQEQIRSEVQRKKVGAWINNTGRSRVVPGTGRIVNVQTRWHEEDATGFALRNRWTQLRLQAMADDDGCDQYATLIVWDHLRAERLARELETDGWLFVAETMGSEDNDSLKWEFKIFLHSNGPSLWPERFPAEGDTDYSLAAIRASMPLQEWATTYQSLPVPEGGAIIPVEAFQHYDWKDLSLRNQPWAQKIQSWDTAYGKSNYGDFSVCTTWGLHRNGSMWLLDLYRARIPFPELKEQTLALYLKQVPVPNLVLIEDAASGQSLIQEMKNPDDSRLYRVPVLAVKADRDKIARANSVTGHIAAGKVFIPGNAPFSADYIAELALFPNGSHDDQVDSTVQAIRRLVQAAASAALAEQPGERQTSLGNFFNVEF